MLLFFLRKLQEVIHSEIIYMASRPKYNTMGFAAVAKLYLHQNGLLLVELRYETGLCTNPFCVHDRALDITLAV